MIKKIVNNLISRFDTWVENNISGSSTEARWGFAGVSIALILFTLSLIVNFFFQNLSHIIGIIVVIILIPAIFLTFRVLWRWKKKPLKNEVYEQHISIEKKINEMNDSLTQKINDLREELRQNKNGENRK
jgi:K+ transporter